MTALLRGLRWAAVAWLALAAAPVLGHEVRPAYLELREVAVGEFAVLWKTPMQGELRLALTPAFSGRTERVSPVAAQQAGGAAIQRWRLRAVDPLPGQTLSIDGLDATLTDALVRVEFADGTAWMKRLTGTEPAATIPARPSAGALAADYLTLGIEHILTGADHLLFIVGLLMLTQGAWALVKTVTAFTVAHSITLALATLGVVHVPSAPIEAAIALSIAFVAAEVLCARRGRRGLASRAPWIVAFAFGLLHGFGFAGALAEVGLPQGAIPLALLFFNLGVEAGQLMFVAAVFALAVLVRKWWPRGERAAETVVAYVIGSLAMFWVVQRVAAF